MSVSQELTVSWKLISMIYHVFHQYLKGSQKILGCHYLKILLLLESISYSTNTSYFSTLSRRTMATSTPITRRPSLLTSPHFMSWPALLVIDMAYSTISVMVMFTAWKWRTKATSNMVSCRPSMPSRSPIVSSSSILMIATPYTSLMTTCTCITCPRSKGSSSTTSLVMIITSSIPMYSLSKVLVTSPVKLRELIIPVMYIWPYTLQCM